jgi:hypothetical protein
MKKDVDYKNKTRITHAQIKLPYPYHRVIQYLSETENESMQIIYGEIVKKYVNENKPEILKLFLSDEEENWRKPK